MCSKVKSSKINRAVNLLAVPFSLHIHYPGSSAPFTDISCVLHHAYD